MAKASSAKKEFSDKIRMFKIISSVALVIGIIGILIGAYSLASISNLNLELNNVTSIIHNVSSSTQVSAAQTPQTLAGIDQPFNETQLGVINNAPLQYFEKAGMMYLNHSLVNEVGAQTVNVSAFYANGKPSVIYLGSITCIFCGENRWAMALALSRFGNFTALYKGYSSFGDGDVPTIYWSQDNYNISTLDTGAHYQSKYINFIVFEDTGPITGGFSLQPLSTIQQEVNATGNVTYENAFSLILKLNSFQGTPYTIWGDNQVGGADAIDFGNTTPTSTSNLEIAHMTHAQILSEFAAPNDQFGWTEYAAADLYIAMLCPSINNAAPVCSLPAIKQIIAQNHYV